MTRVRLFFFDAAIGGAVAWTVALFLRGGFLSSMVRAFLLLLALAVIVGLIRLFVAVRRQYRAKSVGKGQGHVLSIVEGAVLVGAALLLIPFFADWIYGSGLRSLSMLPHGNWFMAGDAGWMYAALAGIFFLALFFKRDKVAKPPRAQRTRSGSSFFHRKKKEPVPTYSHEESLDILAGVHAGVQ